MPSRIEEFRISESDRFIKINYYDSLSTYQVEVSPNTPANLNLTYINGISIMQGGDDIADSKYGSINFKDASTSTTGYTPGRVLHVHFDSSTEMDIIIDRHWCHYNPNADADDMYERHDKLVDNATSFELLRVNPKLTGNIKVVVDSNSNMYLDTFKVSTALSQSKYRRISINPDEYYGTTLMNNIKAMPSDDLYKIEDGCYELFAPASNLDYQYYDTYNSGVRTNSDEMYSENFSLLAPLCIRKNMPDFFLIFKVPSDYNNIANDKSRLEYFLTNGTLIKSYDLREDSNIGKYIRNIYKKAKDFVGDLYLGYDYDSYNAYNAISIDRGVVAEIYESIAPERNIINQVGMNDWYTLGFERNHIVSKDIINFEYMFDDKDASMFSLNTYYGLYVRLNGVTGGFTCIGKDSSGYVFDKSVNGSLDASHYFNPSDFPSTIYGFSTPDKFDRLYSNIKNDASVSTQIDPYVLKPYQCVADPVADDINEVADKSFCSVKLNDVANPGEHYRIIDGSTHMIYEVLISNHISDRDNSDVTYHYKTYSLDSSYNFEIRSISVFNNKYRCNVPDASKSDIIKDQVSKIAKAFNELTSDSSTSYTAYDNGIDSFSILYNMESRLGSGFFETDMNIVCMEKVDSVSGFTQTEDNFIQSDEYKDNSSYFFGIPGIDPVYISYTDSSYQSLFFPHGMEHLGSRMVRAIRFSPITQMAGGVITHALYNIDEDITTKINGVDTTIFQIDASTETYDIFTQPTMVEDDTFTVYYYDNDASNNTGTLSKMCVTGYGNSEKYVIKLKTTPYIINNRIRFYQNYPLNCGLCSIFPLKDFNYNVIDSRSAISLGTTDPDKIISNTAGEYQTTDNVFGTAICSGTEESVCDYIDKCEKFRINGNKYVFTSTLSAYLSNLNSQNHKYSDISLISPYCCKWQLAGTDHRGFPMRVMYSLTNNSNGISSIINGDSYYIPDASLCYIGYPTIDSSIMDSSVTSSDILRKYVNTHLVRDEYPTYRDYILYGDGNLDDIMYGEGSTDNKWSKAYSYGSDSLEFISGGLKLRITSNNKSIINFSKYNGYSAALICMSGSNPLHENACEVIVDETKEQLLYIVYNGTNAEHMKYNEDLMVYRATQIPHHSAISDCRVAFYGGRKKIKVPDDGMYFNDTSLYFIDSSGNGEGYMVLSSPQKSFSDYTVEKYISVYGTIDGSIYNPLDSSNLYMGHDSSGVNQLKIMIDSSSHSVTNFTLKNKCDKYNNNVDAFIYSELDGSIGVTKTSGKPYTLNVIKSLINDVAVLVKTHHGTNDYTGIEDLLTVTFVDPYNMTRENSTFQSVTTGNVYDGLVEPVTKNVLSFDYDASTTLNEIFHKNFDGCNIKVNEIENIYQTWLRKVIVPSAKLSNTTLSEWIDVAEAPYIALTLKTLDSSTIREIPSQTKLYRQTSSNGALSEFVIDSSNLNTYLTHLTSIDGVSELTKKPEINETWYGYLATTKIGEYKILDTSVYMDPDGYYFGTVLFSIESGYYLNTDGVNSIVIKWSDDQSHYFETNWLSLPDYFQTCYTGGTITISPKSTEYSLDNTDSSIYALNASGRIDASSYIEYTLATITSDSSISNKSSLNITQATAIALKHNIKPTYDCWHTSMYRIYSDYDSFVEYDGITAGYEKNIFLASRGLSLKEPDIYGNLSKTITLTDWSEFVTDDINFSVEIDLTTTLINHILLSIGYASNWANLTTATDKLKINYIENSILKYIKINNTTNVKVYRLTDSGLFGFDSLDESDMSKYTEETNVTTSLSYINEKYYLTISNLGNYQYSAKVIINP